jgi:hypothetical protein
MDMMGVYSRRQFRSVRSLILASATVCHCMLPGEAFGAAPVDNYIRHDQWLAVPRMIVGHSAGKDKAVGDRPSLLYSTLRRIQARLLETHCKPGGDARFTAEGVGRIDFGHAKVLQSALHKELDGLRWRRSSRS